MEKVVEVNEQKSEVELIGFSKIYTKLNEKLQKEEEFVYEVCLLLIGLKEMKRGFKIKKINKANKRGTKIKFVAFESVEDAEKHLKDFDIKIGEFNSKWRDKDCKLDIDAIQKQFVGE